MKTNLFLIALAALLFTGAKNAAAWQPAGDRIKTRWAADVDPSCPLPEYPRPALVRDRWLNLNGEWDYAVRSVSEGEPADYDGKILVPFPVESSLSGVQREVGAANALWYRRSFTVPASWKGERILLHFGAVDYEAEVWLNGVKVGSHSGGYTAFRFDLTPYLTRGEQRLVVRVWDPTDAGPQPRGKQRSKPEAIWYTPVTGIWQTVWLEPVGVSRIEGLYTTPDIDTRRLCVVPSVGNAAEGDVVEITLRDGGKTVAQARCVAGLPVTLPVPGMKLWTPEEPFLYDLEVTLLRGGRVLDRVGSYAAMRKISVKRTVGDAVRIQLNNRDYVQLGLLDQGWWPDGLYTAPTDEALTYDILKTKELGFNTIRKHIKVEPARWYAHCDRLGVLVWQDMPSGDENPRWIPDRWFDDRELVRSAASEEAFRREWRGIIDQLRCHPSIVMWVPFNEAWGQFKTREIAEWTKGYDPSRLVDAASGGNHYPGAGDVFDVHAYPHPRIHTTDNSRPLVIGEYGGIGLALKDHLWLPDRNWGYVQYKTPEEATDEYVRFAELLRQLVVAGVSGAIYTQTTDVEIEVNGLMTYDRAVVKFDPERVRKANEAVLGALNDF